MSEDAIAALVIGYLAGCLVTLFSVDDFVALGRKVFLWPLFWLYLAADCLVLLWRGRQ